MTFSQLKLFCSRNRWLLLLLAAAFAVRLGVALPGILEDPAARFSRPDTPGYLEPARALVAEGTPLSAGRAPGFPLFAALVFRCFGVEAYGALAVLLVLVNTATLIPVWLAGREAGSSTAGVIAAALLGLNLTMTAQAPMFLSDTLAAFFAAWQFYFFVRFWKRREMWSFPVMIAVAALGALIRPINSAWIWPALFLLAVLPELPWRRKLALGAVSLAVFGAILFPRMAHNAARGAGFCIDTNTGAMYHQNGAMLLAKVNGTDYEAEKQKILAELDREFADKERYPDEKSRVDYRLKRFKELILAHPFAWFPQHLQWRILLPDAPTFLEILGATTSDRGTMNVLQAQGVWAAVRFYFDGKLYLLWLLAPLLAVTGILYLAAFGLLASWFWRWKSKWYAIFVFLAFAEYYFFLPGPITAPRYQLPALPILTLMAAFGLIQGWDWVKRRQKER